MSFCPEARAFFRRAVKRLLAFCDAMSELWSRPLLLALLSLGAVGLLVGLPRRVARARSWALFRGLVPAWRFFESIEPVPALHYRFATHTDAWSDWHDALPVPPRTLASLLSNPAGSLHLACQSLIEHLVSDLENAKGLERDAAELVSYRLVCALVEQRVRTALPARPGLRYQFRLAGAERGDAPSLLSDVHVIP
jgi:hypothetical protein